MVNGKGFGRKQPRCNRGTISTFAWRDCGKPTKNFSQDNPRRGLKKAPREWNAKKEMWPYSTLTTFQSLKLTVTSHVIFVVPTEVLLDIQVFWDITPSLFVNIYELIECS
jgi:hypothetical protein